MTAPNEGASAPGRVLVLNPNSSRKVTASLVEATSGWGRPGVRFQVSQIDAAPVAIASPADHARVGPLVVEALTDAAADFDVAVVACHGDPGVAAARLRVSAPVIGIGAASLHAAAATTPRFAVLALSRQLVESKWHQVDEAGTRPQCVGIWPVDTTVEHGLTPDTDLNPYLTAGRQALAAGAQLLVLGCAGMGPLAGRLAAQLGIPVLDPTATAVQLASELAVQMAASGTGSTGPAHGRRFPEAPYPVRTP